MKNIERLLAPIGPDATTGCNVRSDAQSSALYYQLKDARSAARLIERQSDSEPERGSLAPEWRTVSELAQGILEKTSKDIEVAVWLVEAAIRLDGFAGLRDGFTVLNGLVERYWPDLHSLDADDISTKVAPITGLNGSGADGSLIQPMRLAPFTAAGSGGAAGLWQYMVMRRRGAAAPEAVALAAAVKATSAASLVEHYHAIDQALAQWNALSARLDALCGEEAPPSSTIRAVLEEAKDAMRAVAADALASVEGEMVEEVEHVVHAAPEPMQPEPSPAPVAEAGPQPLRTRDDALRELSRIATFFREHEPNAPTAYSLETLIRRARIPLHDLLAELIPDEATRQLYLDRAGIRPGTP